ncbi:MAG: hypothetical protein AAB570_03455, partial [Patescibacteria group bacterium]
MEPLTRAALIRALQLVLGVEDALTRLQVVRAHMALMQYPTHHEPTWCHTLLSDVFGHDIASSCRQDVFRVYRRYLGSTAA